MALNINGTTGISGVDGSASAASIAGTDANTGLSFASDTVNINTGGSTRVTVDSNGRLGVGVTSPDQEFHVKGGGTVATFEGTGGGGSIGIKDSDDGTVAFIVVDAGKFKIQTSGGGYSDKLIVEPNGDIIFGTTAVSTFGEKFRFFTNVDEPVINIDSASVGTAAAVVLRHARGGLSGFSGKAFSFVGNDNTEEGSIVIGTTSTAFNTSSDYRLKENEVAISDGITRLKTLKPYKFNFKKDPDVKVDGFFAHEVSSIIPEAITGTKDETEDILYTEKDTIPSGKKVGDVKETVPKYQGIDQSKLVPLLTAALQEAVAKIEVLETKVAALEAG